MADLGTHEIRRLGWNHRACRVLAQRIVTWNGWITIELLLAFALFIGSLNGVAFPADFAIMPKLVPRADLTTAIAFQSSVSQSARFIGPALAGVLIVWGGAGMAFAFNTVSYSAFLIALALIRIDEGDESRTPSSGVVRDLTAGIRYAWSSLPIRLLLIVAIALGILLRPVIELMPAYVGSVLEAGAPELASLLAAAGAGAMCASLWLARRGTTQALTRIMLTTFILTTAVLITFLYAGSFAIAVGSIFIYGFCASAVLISNQSILDDHMRARVMSLYGLTVQAFPAFGGFVVGLLASRAGLVPSVLGGALLACLAWLWIRGATRRNRIAETIEHADITGS